jgi:DNA-binding transcriptional LysR family regulator
VHVTLYIAIERRYGRCVSIPDLNLLVALDVLLAEGSVARGAQGLFRDRFIGVVRIGHPLSQGEITASRYAAGRHVLVSRRGVDTGPIHETLESFGLQREIATIVGGFSAALALARASDLIATVPERHTENLRAGMFSFSLPVSAPEITVSLLWHPRLDADAAHRWLRGCVRDVCAEQLAR